MSLSSEVLRRGDRSAAAGKPSTVLKFRSRKLSALPSKRRPRVLLLQGPVGPFLHN